MSRFELIHRHCSSLKKKIEENARLISLISLFWILLNLANVQWIGLDSAETVHLNIHYRHLCIFCVCFVSLSFHYGTSYAF